MPIFHLHLKMEKVADEDMLEDTEAIASIQQHGIDEWVQELLLLCMPQESRDEFLLSILNKNFQDILRDLFNDIATLCHYHNRFTFETTDVYHAWNLMQTKRIHTYPLAGDGDFGESCEDDDENEDPTYCIEVERIASLEPSDIDAMILDEAHDDGCEDEDSSSDSVDSTISAGSIIDRLNMTNYSSSHPWFGILQHFMEVSNIPFAAKDAALSLGRLVVDHTCRSFRNYEDWLVRKLSST